MHRCQGEHSQVCCTKWLQCGQAVLACHKVTASLSSLSIGWGKKFLHHSTLLKKFSKKKKNSSININPNSPTFVFCLVISPLWAYKTRYQQNLKLNLWWQEKSNSIIFNHLNQSDIQGIKTISKMQWSFWWKLRTRLTIIILALSSVPLFFKVHLHNPGVISQTI